MFHSLRQKLLRLRQSGPDEPVPRPLDLSECGYPKTELSQDFPEGPGQSIINLKRRLALAQTIPAQHTNEKLLQYRKESLEYLLALEPFWTQALQGEPPFKLSPEFEETFILAVREFFEFNRWKVEAILCAFGFLELFSRESPNRRLSIAELLPDELGVFRDYLTNPEKFKAEQLRTKAPQVEDPDLAFQTWMVAELRHTARLTEAEIALLSEKLYDLESILHALRGYPADKPSPEARTRAISILLHNRAIDPESPIPTVLQRKLEEAYELELSVVFCKRCKAGHRPASMKTSDICWGCWDL